jgi:hypothetical protein
LKCSYEEYRQTIFDTNYIFHYIDSMGLAVGAAQERHFRKWPILGISGPAPEVNAIATTYAAELDTLKAWIGLRLQWLDANMPGLCVETGAYTPSQNQSWVQYYPNPTNGMVHFEGVINGALPARCAFYDATGRVVANIELSSETVSFDHLLEASGVYYFRLSDVSGRAQHGKIIRM